MGELPCSRGLKIKQKKFLKIFLDATAIGRRQASRINVRDLGLVFLFGQAVGSLDGKMPQFVHELLEITHVERVGLEHRHGEIVQDILT